MERASKVSFVDTATLLVDKAQRANLAKSGGCAPKMLRALS
jgi:hypothetical protein